MWKQLIKSISVQSLGKVITILMSLATTAILTRRLGVSNYGLFALTTSIFLMVDSIADFGTRIIGVREASIAADDKEKVKIWVNTFILRKILTSVAFGGGLLLVMFYDAFEGVRWWVLLALIMTWFTSIAGDEEVVFQTQMRMDLKTIVDVVFPAGFLVLALILGEKINLGWVFGGYLGSRIVSLMVGWRLIRNVKLLISNVKWKTLIDRNLIKKLLSESWAMGIYLLVFTSYDRAVDSAIIRHFWTTADVAQYGLAYKIYTNLVMPAYFLVSSVFPIMAKGENKLITKKSLLLAGLMVAGLVPTAWILAPWMIEVLAGGAFSISAEVLRILLLALIFGYFSHVLGFEMISQGKQNSMLRLGIVALVVNISLNLLLIPIYGIWAAAWVTVITEAVTLALMVVMREKITSK